MRSLVLAALLALPAALPAEEGYLPKVQVDLLAAATRDAGNQPIRYPATDSPEVRALIVEIPPGAETGWHRHTYPCYAYLLQGELEVSMEGGRKNTLKAGDALVESVGLWHNGRNTGTEPVKLVLFVTGERGKPFTVRTD